MSSLLPLRCRCGLVRGTASDVSPSTGLRFTCYCKDCQTFARFLGRPEVLDPAGGTDIFQLPVGLVRLTEGSDRLGALRLSDKVIRWYADCCRTPIGNSASTPRFPIVAIIHAFMDHEADGHARDEALGPPLCRLYARSATGPLPEHAPPPLSFGVFARRASVMFQSFRRGLTRPSPFFDEQGFPVAEPRVLTDEERQKLR